MGDTEYMMLNDIRVFVNATNLANLTTTNLTLSSNVDHWEAPNLNDGDYLSYWQNDDISTANLTWNFSAPQRINLIEYVYRYAEPGNYTVLVSDDAETWTAIAEGQMSNITGLVEYINFSTQEKQYLRLWIKSSGDGNMGAGEVKIWGQPQNLTGLLCDKGSVSTTCNITTPQYLQDDTEYHLNNLVIKDGGSLINDTSNCTSDRYPEGAHHGCGFSLILAGNLTIESGGNITAGNVSILADNVDVRAGGKIVTDGLGWMAGMGPCGSSTYAACYGGYTDTYENKIAYGSAIQPSDFGSGGKGHPGGGIVFINSTNEVNISGVISSDGGELINGGAGGSIWIISSSFNGDGNLSAEGGDGVPGSVTDGGGGGGRISINYTTDSFNGYYLLDGGKGDRVGTPGTLWHPWNSSINLTLKSDMALYPGNYTMNILNVTNGAKLWIYGSNVNEGSGGYGVQINAQKVYVDESSAIRADGMGSGYGSGYGPGGGGLKIGGTHAGKGGGNTDATYGSMTEPLDLGSGGGITSLTIRIYYSGGGAIKLNVTNEIVFNGNITADAGYWGAGGSIWLIAESITGMGKISARALNSLTDGYRAGGGGRIALYAPTISLSDLADVSGGIYTVSDNPPYDGSAGTIFINATNSITSTGNITATGYNGSTARINLTSEVLNLTGIYNASSIVDPQGIITLNYSYCSSVFAGAVADPGALLITPCTTPLEMTYSSVNRTTDGTSTNATSPIGLQKSLRVNATLENIIGLDSVWYIVWSGNYESQVIDKAFMEENGSYYSTILTINKSFPSRYVNITIFANDTTRTNISSNLSFYADVIAPWNITFFDPTPADNDAGGQGISLNWTVLDDQDSNLSCYTVIDDLETSLIYTANGTYGNKSLTLAGGRYNLSIRCYDNANNSNQSETRWYTVGVINISAPLNNEIVRPGQNITVTVSVLYGEDYINNVTLHIHNLTGIEQLWLSNLTLTDYNATYNVANGTPRYLNVTVYGFNNAVGSHINITDNIRLRLGRPSTLPPTMPYFCANESYTINGTKINIITDFDLDTLVENVNLTVLNPAAHIVAADHSINSTDENGSNDYISQFNFTFTTNSTGTYVLTASVMDMENQTFSTNFTVKASQSRTVNWSSPSITNIQLKETCTGKVLSDAATISRALPEASIYNLDISLENEPKSISFYAANISYANVSDLISHTVRTNETNPPEGERRVSMFDIEANMSFDNFTMIYNYSSISHTLTDESNMDMYRCEDESDCTFVKQNITMNETMDRITLVRTTLSRYILTEPALSGQPEQYDPPKIIRLNTTRTYVNANTSLKITLVFNISLLLDAVTLTVNDEALSPYNTTSSDMTYWYHYNYTPTALGSYSIDATVFDENTFNDTASMTFYSRNNASITLRANGSNKIELRDINNNATLFNGSVISALTPTGNYNVYVNTNLTDITIFNATLNESTADILEFDDISDILTIPDDKESIEQFELNSSLLYNHIEVIYNYTNKTDIINDEDNLEVYKCEASNCTWMEVNDTIIDKDRNTIRFALTNLSVFLIAESTRSETETITITTSTSGGGGGGSSRTVTEYLDKIVALKFITTSPLTMYSEDIINARVIASNVGEVDFEAIDVDIMSDSDDISVVPTKTEIASLLSGASESFTLNIESHTDPGIYQIDIVGISDSPEYTEEAKIIIQLIERNVSVANETKIVEKIRFAYDLFKENPECLELQEVITQANSALDMEEHEKAKALVESAINACKETITAINRELPRPAPKKMDIVKIVMAVILLTLIIWLLMELWIRRGRRKPETGQINAKILKTRKIISRPEPKKEEPKDIWAR